MNVNVKRDPTKLWRVRLREFMGERVDIQKTARRWEGALFALIGFLVIAASPSAAAASDTIDETFQRVAPIFEGRCISCHNSYGTSEGGLSLDRADVAARQPPDYRPVIDPVDPDRSLLLRVVTGAEPKMPQGGEPLSEDQIRALRAWIVAGAPWPAGLELRERPDISTDWWALRPLTAPDVPQPAAPTAAYADWAHNPIDAFVLDKLQQQGMRPSPPADRRTLIRRLYFDLIGLPPTPRQVEAFLADDRPDAYENLVDQLLASPHYGERWARHWMDVARYAESHGHDEDVPRENAWPYRDYLIRAFNDDLPYSRFIEQQLAGDALYGDDPWATAALGFLAAGPWDQSSQMGIQDGTHDKLVAQVIDRDEMISAAVGSLNSVTVTCARCHSHKFDPVTKEDYYSLQAVFSGVDRHDIPFDPDPAVHQHRRELERRRQDLATMTVDQLNDDAVQQRVAEWEQQRLAGDSTWHQVDAAVVLTSEGSTFEKLDDQSVLFTGDAPQTETYSISGGTDLTGVTAVRLELLPHESLPGKGPGRAPQSPGNLHLSEFEIHAAPEPGMQPHRRGIRRAFASFNQSGWTIDHAIDGNRETAWGIHPQEGQAHEAVFVLDQPIDFEGVWLTFVLRQLHGGQHVIGRLRLSVTTAAEPETAASLPAEIAAILDIPAEARDRQQRADLAQYVLEQEIQEEHNDLPAPQLVYAVASDFEPRGNYRPARGPRPVHVLRRGDIDRPIEPAAPGALSWIDELPARFDLENPEDEAARRAALARWISDDRNVMTWRSIVNRVWHYHFGRGIVATPDDFGRMGAQPTHPQLLDYLALWFRDEAGQSFKRLHRLIVTSATYRQASTYQAEYAAQDADNQYVGRMNRRRMAAEQVTDAVLAISGTLDRTMGGPSVRQFIQSPGVHETPEVDYQNFDPHDPANHRRAVYRFHMRTLPDPLMESLDCPSGSQATPVRGDTVTPLQALAMMNSPFMIGQAEHLADRLAAKSDDVAEQIRHLYRLTLQREPTDRELAAVAQYVQDHGLAAACRLKFNTNAFMFLD